MFWLSILVAFINVTLTARSLLATDYDAYYHIILNERWDVSFSAQNDIPQIDDLIDSFDFGVNEACLEFDECDAYHRFTREQKVWGVVHSDRLCRFEQTGDALY